MIDISAVTPNIGALIQGADLKHLDDATFRRIHQAWLDHQVLLIRGQSLSDDELMRFSRRFGPLEEIPYGRISQADKAKIKNRFVTVISNVVVDGKPIGGLANAEATWHSDMTYIPDPPPASVLYAVEVPPAGGDTWFCSQYAALASLPVDLRNQVQDLTLKHNAAHTSVGSLRRGFKAFSSPADAPGAVHPIISTHSETGREVLFLGRREWACIPGLAAQDSERLLDALWQHVALPDHTMRHQWQVGDVVIWDNRCVLHRRDGFRDDYRRLMRRCQVRSAA